MNFYFLILFLVKVLCEGMFLNVDLSLEIFSKAFDNVTRHLFQLETRMFINNYGVDSDKITSLILKNLNENAMPFQLKNLQIEKKTILLDSSTFLTFKNFSFVKEFNQKLKLTNEYFKPLQLFVYCQHATMSDIESLKLDVTEKAKNNKMVEVVFRNIEEQVAEFNSYLVDIIQYEYFLVDETNFIKLLTFVWFSPEKCGELQLIELNKFNKMTQKWENDKFSMKKAANLHGCKIIEAEAPSDMIAMTQLDYDVKNSLEVLNNATILGGSGSIDILFSKGCYNAFDRYRYKNDTDRSGKGIDINFITFPLEYTNSRLMTNDLPEYYSEYDKLLMPFDEFTWAMIAITFAIAFATILILYCCVKKSIRDFIIGSNVHTPWLNVMQIFFGISQTVMPRKSFARFLAMVFILYCLIIRTTWQGKTFEFMQKNIEIPKVHTIDELIEKGYTFIMEKNYKEKFPESEISKRGKVTSVNSDTKEVLYVMQTIPCYIQWVPQYLDNFGIEWKKSRLKRMMKEDLHLSICGLKFPRHHHLFESIDDRVQQHFVGGIFMHPLFGRACGSATWPELKIKLFKVFEEPKVLTMKMLEPGFVIWISSLLFAVAAFILEWITTLKDYLVMKYILHAFYSLRH